MEKDVRKNFERLIKEADEYCITLTDQGIGAYASVKDSLVALVSLIHHLKYSENISEDLINESIKIGLLSDEELPERAGELAKEFMKKLLKGE